MLIKEILARSNNNIQAAELNSISGEHIIRLTTYGWPGNIRELQNVTRQLQLGYSVLDHLEPNEAIVMSDAAKTTPTNSRVQYEDPATIDDEALIAALDSVNWVIKDAARALNISRTALYDLMAKSSRVRNIDDIPEAELRSVITSTPGGINEWVKHLRVGRESLRRKIQKLAD